jgi:hypothetical protein
MLRLVGAGAGEPIYDKQHNFSGRVSPREASPQLKLLINFKFANDSLANIDRHGGQAMSKRAYVTTQRLTQLRASLSQKDITVMSDVARMNVMSGNQIRHLHFGHSDSDRRMARLTLERLTAAQVLARLGRRVGGQRSGSDGFCYALGVAGQRLSYSDKRRSRPPWTPAVSHIAHVLAVSQIYVDMMTGPRSTALMHFDAEPECWRPFSGIGGGRQVLKPDAYVVTTSGEYDDHWFVELDRSTESATRIAEKLKIYVRYFQSGKEQAKNGVFPWVVWCVPSDRRLDQITTVISALPPEHRPIFTVTDDFSRLIDVPQLQHLKGGE